MSVMRYSMYVTAMAVTTWVFLASMMPWMLGAPRDVTWVAADVVRESSVPGDVDAATFVADTFERVAATHDEVTFVVDRVDGGVRVNDGRGCVVFPLGDDRSFEMERMCRYFAKWQRLQEK